MRHSSSNFGIIRLALSYRTLKSFHPLQVKSKVASGGEPGDDAKPCLHVINHFSTKLNKALALTVLPHWSRIRYDEELAEYTGDSQAVSFFIESNRNESKRNTVEMRNTRYHCRLLSRYYGCRCWHRLSNHCDSISQARHTVLAFRLVEECSFWLRSRERTPPKVSFEEPDCYVL